HCPECVVVGGVDGQGVQHRGAVTVENAFRPARGAGGVAQRAGSVFVEVRPVECLVGLRHQVFVAVQGHAGGQLQVRYLGGVGQQHDVADAAGQAGGDLGDQRHERQIGEQDGIAGVGD